MRIQRACALSSDNKIFQIVSSNERREGGKMETCKLWYEADEQASDGRGREKVREQ